VCLAGVLGDQLHIYLHAISSQPKVGVYIPVTLVLAWGDQTPSRPRMVEGKKVCLHFVTCMAQLIDSPHRRRCERIFQSNSSQ